MQNESDSLMTIFQILGGRDLPDPPSTLKTLMKPNPTPDYFLLKGCRTGVEKEFEQVEVADVDAVAMDRAGWSGKPDGSLRDGGWEWVLRTPLADEHLKGAIAYALEMARRRNYQVSLRTGLHTHVNVKDMTFSQYKLMLLMYALIEPSIFRYAGCDRDENVNCLPWYSASDGEHYVSSVYNATPRTLAEIIRTDARYAGLNIAATSRFGSVEWRHMRATLDDEVVMKWISINHRIKEAAIRLSGNKGFHEDFVPWFSNNPKLALEEILQPEQARLLWYPEIVDDCMKIGLRTVINIQQRCRPRFRSLDDWEGGSMELGNSAPLEKFFKKSAQQASPIKRPSSPYDVNIEDMAARQEEILRQVRRRAEDNLNVWANAFDAQVARQAVRRDRNAVRRQQPAPHQNAGLEAIRMQDAEDEFAPMLDVAQGVIRVRN